MVLLDRDITRFPLRSSHDLIALDNVQAGFLAADHLLRLGCHDLRIFAVPGAASSVDARAAGIRDAILLRSETKQRAGNNYLCPLNLRGGCGLLNFFRQFLVNLTPKRPQPALTYLSGMVSGSRGGSCCRSVRYRLL